MPDFGIGIARSIQVPDGDPNRLPQDGIVGRDPSQGFEEVFDVIVVTDSPQRFRRRLDDSCVIRLKGLDHLLMKFLRNLRQLAGESQRFHTHPGCGIGSQLGQISLAQTAVQPSRGHGGYPSVRRLVVITHERFELVSDRDGFSDRRPPQRSIGTAKTVDRRTLRHWQVRPSISGRGRFFADVSNLPDPTTLAVTTGVVQRNLVVPDDLVVEIGHV